MNLRLKKWMETKLLKPSELADKINVNRATVSHILSGRNKPSIEFLQKLLNKYPNLNSNWLITGIGYMIKENNNTRENITKKIKKIMIVFDDKTFEEVENQ